MDLGVLKGPAELLASKMKAFKNCLELATECLTNKDYFNAEMIYGGILADLHKDCFVEALNFNDLQLFSLHSCFAYSSIGVDYKSEQALLILNSIHKAIKLPLVPYLKAFIHLSNDRLSFALDELQFCHALLNDGYNFKPNSILNEEIIPEINDEFLKLKINGLQVACELLQAKEDNLELKKCFKENWMKLGKLCETDFAKLAKKEEEKEDGARKEAGDKKMKKGGQNQGAIKKTTDKHPQQSKSETASIGIQTMTRKGINIAVQTTENKDKEINKQLLTTLLEIKNKMNNMQSKKDNEIKQLQKKNDELTEKLLARDNKRQERMTEFEFVKEQFVTLEKKYEQSQKHIELLQKLLVEHLQQKYNMQKNIYQMFEEKCDYKIEYLVDVQKYLIPTDRPTPEECKQEVCMWKSTLNKVAGAKRDFEAYYRTIDDLIVAKKYYTIKTNEWPAIPTIPNDAQDIIYRNYKIIIQQSKSLFSFTFPNNYSHMSGNFGNQKENNFHNPSYFLNGYNGYKEDGRTTGSPPFYAKFNPSVSITNGSGKYSQQYQHQQQQPPHSPYQQQPYQQQSYQQQSYQQQQQQQNVRGKKFEVASATAPTQNEVINYYKSEQELLKYIQSNFKDLSEIELLDAVYQVRDASGGTLIGLPKKALLDEIKKVLKKNAGGAKSTWTSVGQTRWQNDHSDNKCCICFEEYDATSSHSLSCQHEFHKKCITNWLKRQSACPVCRVHAVIDDEYPPLKV